MIAGPPSLLDVVFDRIAATVRKLTKLLRRKPPPKRKKRRPSSKKPKLGPNRARSAKVLAFDPKRKKAANE